MALVHQPKAGEVLRCDFNLRAQPYPPEMRKKRPVVVVGQVSANLCIVVSVSTKAPHDRKPYHHQLDIAPLPTMLQAKPNWAKCDMIHTVAFWRLDRFFERVGGKRAYGHYHVTDTDLAAIRDGVKSALRL